MIAKRGPPGLGLPPAGVLVAAVALGVTQRTAELSSPIDAIGEVGINHTPIAVKEFAITHFGSLGKMYW